MIWVLLDGLVALCRVAAMALVALLGACASLTVADTVPLSPGALRRQTATASRSAAIGWAH